MNNIKLPKCKLAADDAEMRHRCENLRKRLLGIDDIVSNGEKKHRIKKTEKPPRENGTKKHGVQVEVVDENGNKLFVSDVVDLKQLQSLLISHIKLLVDDDEIGLSEIEEIFEKNNTSRCWKINAVCDWLCALIRVISCFYTNSICLTYRHEKKPSQSDSIKTIKYLMSPTLWGERVKVKIGMNTIKAKDLGAFLVENSSSIHICLTNETGGHLGDSYVVLQEVEKYLENLRKRHLLPSSDYSGWKFGCIYS